MREYIIHIVGLTDTLHRFEFTLGKAFFEHYGSELIAEGSFDADVVLDKHETFIEARFDIRGIAMLVCDRSLETFEYPVHVEKKVIYKFSHEGADGGDDVVVIDWNAQSLDVGQLMYEFVALAIPMKKLHPRFAQEDEAPETIVYKTQSEKEADPRWQALLKLKSN